MIAPLTVADLGLRWDLTNQQALEIARKIWGEKILAYSSTTNGFFFIARWPSLADVDPEWDGRIMPSDILGYGPTWAAAFEMALETIPILIQKEEPEPWAGNIPMGQRYDPFLNWAMWNHYYSLNFYPRTIFPKPAPPEPPKPEPKKKQKQIKNWLTDLQPKIPQPGPKPKLKGKK